MLPWQRKLPRLQASRKSTAVKDPEGLSVHRRVFAGDSGREAGWKVCLSTGIPPARLLLIQSFFVEAELPCSCDQFCLTGCVAVYLSPCFFAREPWVWLSTGYEEQKQLIEDALLLPLLHPQTYNEIAKGTRAQFASNRPRAVLFEVRLGLPVCLPACLPAQVSVCPSEVCVSANRLQAVLFEVWICRFVCLSVGPSEVSSSVRLSVCPSVRPSHPFGPSICGGADAGSVFPSAAVFRCALPFRRALPVCPLCAAVPRSLSVPRAAHSPSVHSRRRSRSAPICPPRAGCDHITETNRVHAVLFGMQNVTFVPYLAAINRILISLMPIACRARQGAARRLPRE
jgi:hypothetical protein